MMILDIIVNLLLAAVICILIEILHEYLHVYKARQLGYNVKNISIRKAEVDILIDRGDPNWVKIALFPYLFLVPLGFIFILCGWLLGITWLLWSGILVVIFHGISIWLEGRR